MWSKKKLELFVLMTIVTSIGMTTLRLSVLTKYKTGALLMLISNVAKTVISYGNTYKSNSNVKCILPVAALSFLGGLSEVFAYYQKQSPVSYLVMSNMQHTVTAVVSIVWYGIRHTPAQYVGILMILCGFFLEASLAGTSTEISVHMLLCILSGLFNATSLLLFESRVRPSIIGLGCLWKYMTGYGAYLSLLSLLGLAEEMQSGRADYIGMMRSPSTYLLLAAEIGVPYLLSEMTLFLNIVERRTLLNVTTGLSAIFTELYTANEIGLLQFLGFALVVTGVQFLNFFREKR